MAELMMVAIRKHEAGERTIFNTGISTVGRGGDDYFCGHCGRKMIQNMDVSRIEVAIVYECGECGGYNIPAAQD